MSLFEHLLRSNLLSKDGEALYLGPIFSHAEADAALIDLLNNIPWQNDSVVLFGKKLVTSRKVAWVADLAKPYGYSGTTKHAIPWTPLLQSIKQRVENSVGEHFNSCLLNLYHSGAEGMSWHSDDEKSLVPNGTIASLSFGAERKFSFKHKTDRSTAHVSLEAGSLLLMKGHTQSHWLHSLPKSKTITEPRINLTFRQMC